MDSLKIAAESRFATITCAPKKVKRNSLLKNSSLAASELRCGLDTPLLQCFGRGYSASGPYLAYRLVRSRVFQQAGVFCEVRGRLRAGELNGGTGAFYELLQIPHNPLRALPRHRVASIGVHLEPRIGDRPRAPLLFLAPKDGVPLPPQDQRGHLDLTKPGRVIDRKHHPLHIATPDAGRDFEGLRESR